MTTPHRLLRATFAVFMTFAASHALAVTTMNEGARSKPKEAAPKPPPVKHPNGSTSTVSGGVKTTVYPDGTKVHSMPGSTAGNEWQRSRDAAIRATEEKAAAEARARAWMDRQQ